MALATREEGKKVNSNINVTPMVDVMLVLLIIFMVITPMLQKGVSVDMARVNSPTPMPDADKEDSLLVAVMRDGQIFFGTDRIKAEDLTAKVKDRLANKVDKRIFIKADARAKYGNVVDVVDNVRAAGVDDVGLLTEQTTDHHRQETVGNRCYRWWHPVEGFIYVNGSWRVRRRLLGRYQRNPNDRRVAGVAYHLYGDHAADSEGPGRAGSPAA